MAPPIVSIDESPELKVLRDNVPPPPDIISYMNTWMEKGERLSMMKLTANSQTGWDVVHLVAKYIDGTPMENRGNWKDFAGYLGMDILEIGRIANFARTSGATLEILGWFAVQRGTVAGLLQTLQMMGRQDILLAISSRLEAIFNPSTTENDSNSISNSSEMDSGMEGSFCEEADIANLKAAPCERVLLLGCSEEFAETKPPLKTVMLSFAQDGYELAKEIARQIRGMNMGIGVLILEENRAELEFCGESIYRWYQEVDFIIPIITEEYLWQIAPRNEGELDYDVDLNSSCIDAQYTRLIYVMMLEEHMRNRCLNYRIRPIQSSLTKQFQSHSLLHIPIFSCRRKVSEVHRLASLISKCKPRPLIR